MSPLDKTGKKGDVSFLTLFWVSSLTPPSGHCQLEHRNDSALLCLHVFAIIAYFVFGCRKGGAGRRGCLRTRLLFTTSVQVSVSVTAVFISPKPDHVSARIPGESGTCTGNEVWNESCTCTTLTLHRFTAQLCPPIHWRQPIGCGADPGSAAIMGNSFLVVECIRLHLIGPFFLIPLNWNQESLSSDWCVKEYRTLSFCLNEA